MRKRSKTDAPLPAPLAWTEAMSSAEFLARTQPVSEPGAPLGVSLPDNLGGAEGVAQLAGEMQRQLQEQSARVAQVRSAAVNALLLTRSLSDVARSLGVSKSAVAKMAGSGWSASRLDTGRG